MDKQLLILFCEVASASPSVSTTVQLCYSVSIYPGCYDDTYVKSVKSNPLLSVVVDSSFSDDIYDKTTKSHYVKIYFFMGHFNYLRVRNDRKHPSDHS